MELKDKLTAALAVIPGTRVLRVKPGRDRWLVYAVSKTFSAQTYLERQRAIDAALAGAHSPLTPEEIRSIGLVVTYSPRELRGRLAELRANRARRLKQKPAEPTP